LMSGLLVQARSNSVGASEIFRAFLIKFLSSDVKHQARMTLASADARACVAPVRAHSGSSCGTLS
jgi:hypothetical protein